MITAQSYPIRNTTTRTAVSRSKSKSGGEGRCITLVMSTAEKAQSSIKTALAQQKQSEHRHA